MSYFRLFVTYIYKSNQMKFIFLPFSTVSILWLTHEFGNLEKEHDVHFYHGYGCVFFFFWNLLFLFFGSPSLSLSLSHCVCWIETETMPVAMKWQTSQHRCVGKFVFIVPNAFTSDKSEQVYMVSIAYPGGCFFSRIFFAPLTTLKRKITQSVLKRWFFRVWFCTMITNLCHREGFEAE